MHPALITVGAFDVQPKSVALDDVRDVAVKKLRNLCGSYIGIAQHRCDGRDGGDALAQCSGQSTFVGPGVSGGSGRFARHDLQRVTPRKLQMMQTKVPQST